MRRILGRKYTIDKEKWTVVTSRQTEYPYYNELKNMEEDSYVSDGPGHGIINISTKDRIVATLLNYFMDVPSLVEENFTNNQILTAKGNQGAQVLK